MSTATSAMRLPKRGGARVGKPWCVRSLAGDRGLAGLGVLAGFTLWSAGAQQRPSAREYGTTGRPDPSGAVRGWAYVGPAGQFSPCPGHPIASQRRLRGISIPTTGVSTGPPYPTVPAGWQGWFLKSSGRNVSRIIRQGSNPPALVPRAPRYAATGDGLSHELPSSLNGSTPLRVRRSSRVGGTSHP